VTTNLENLEYSGISLNVENSGILVEFCATSGKNCNKQSIFSLLFKYLCKTAVDWVNRIIRNETRSECGGDLLDEGPYYIYFLLR